MVISGEEVFVEGDNVVVDGCLGVDLLPTFHLKSIYFIFSSSIEGTREEELSVSISFSKPIDFGL